MKKLFLSFVIAFLCFIFYADMQKVYCKRCGNSYNSVIAMSNSTCYKSTSKKHEVYEGLITKQFYCIWCGNSYNTLQAMSNSNCFKNPNGRYHDPYEGSLKNKYTCQYCGNSYNTLQTMSNSNCFKSMHRKHVPLR